LIGHS
jgi:hypothetical protein